MVIEGLICYFLELGHRFFLALYIGIQPDAQAFRLELGLIIGSSASQNFWFRQELHCRLSCSSACGRQVEGFLCFHNCVSQSLIYLSTYLYKFYQFCFSRSEVKWKSLSHVQFFATPQTIQSMKFSRPEYWSG